MFDRLGSIQFDPIDVAGRNHDLVLLSRVAGYRREMTDRLLYEERALFETYNKGLSLVPTSELPWYRIDWDRARARHEGQRAGRACRRSSTSCSTGSARPAPMSSTDIAPREAIDWYWRPTNQVRAILEALGESGILGISRREGNRRVYDLAERLFPAELLDERATPRDAFRHKLLSRYRAHGLLGKTGSAELWMGTSPRVGAVYGLEGDLPLAAAGRKVLHAELLEAGALDPRDDRRASAGSATSRPRAAAPRSGRAGDRGRRSARRCRTRVWRSSARSTRSSGIAISCGRCSSSTTSGRSTCRRRSGAGATTSCRSCSATGSSAGSSRGSSARRTRLRIAGLWWEDGFDPLAADGFVEGFAAAVEAHRAFGGVDKVTWPKATRHRPFVRAVRAIGLS